MPDFISAVTVNPSWTNITANSGLDVNKPLRGFLISMLKSTNTTNSQNFKHV